MEAIPEAEGLPSYDSVTQTKTDPIQQHHILGPATLHVAGRFIHSSDPSAPPLYEFSHSIGFLSATDRSVSLQRLDHVVADGATQVHTRKRHLFDLKHPTKAEFPAFDFHAETASRRALCCLGIKPFHPARGLFSSLGNAKRKRYRVHRAVRGRDRRLEEQPDVVFSAAPSRDRGVGFEWSDGEGRLLAREVETNELMSLVVTAEMETETRDALVAAWMLRVWYELAQGNYRGNTWDDGEYLLNVT
ncbi:hypothetical protein B0T10DRAFT_487510 [Thelonectria olida]|uniref:Uncharacterized protein n=1 Tax=Thelonectria olida TaxID=1576542 RepID=A0A9P8W702_9HYPO|nr:hypothetical protein B0T10DRAFT_487510 [Thelonectria olida]